MELSAFTMKIDGIESSIDKVNDLISKLKEAQTLTNELSAELSGLDISFKANEIPEGK